MVLETVNFEKYLLCLEERDNMYKLIDFAELLDILDELLVFINADVKLPIELSLDYVMNNHGGCIKSSRTEMEVWFALRHLGKTVSGSKAVELTQEKVMKALAIKTINSKPDGFILDEFRSTLKAVYDFGIPACLQSTDLA